MLMHYGSVLKEDLMKEQKQLEIERAQRIAEINQMMADKERGARAAEIDKGTEGLIASKIGNRYAGSDAAVADAAAGRTDAPLTPEQLAVIQQSKDGARGDLSMREKLEARIEAGSKAGYDMSKDMNLLAHLSQQETLSEDRKAKRESDKEYRDALIADKNERTRIWEKKVNGAGGGGNGKMPQTLSDADKVEIKENNDAIKDYRKSLLKGEIPPDKAAAVEAEMAKLTQRNQMIMFYARRGGDTNPNESDISGLLQRYTAGDGSAVGKFNTFFGPGSAEKVLAGAADKIAPDAIVGEPAAMPSDTPGRKTPDEIPDHERGLLARLRKSVPAMNEERRAVLEERKARLAPKP